MLKELLLELNTLIFISENGLFIPKYGKYSVIPAYMCTKPCSVPIISWSTKWMTGFRFYLTSDTEHY